MSWDKLADEATLKRTAGALAAIGIEAEVAESGAAAKKRVLEMIPAGAEVMIMSSETLAQTGIDEAINKGNRYKPSRVVLTNEKASKRDKKIAGCVPEWTVGSVHAVTEDGKVVIASNTGSQLAAYVYGAEHVLWVVGAQKIVKNLDEAFKRIYEYVLPLESSRVKKAYGMERSNVSKLLIINKEVVPGRMKMILVREKLGF